MTLKSSTSFRQVGLICIFLFASSCNKFNAQRFEAKGLLGADNKNTPGESLTLGPADGKKPATAQTSSADTTTAAKPPAAVKPAPAPVAAAPPAKPAPVKPTSSDTSAAKPLIVSADATAAKPLVASADPTGARPTPSEDADLAKDHEAVKAATNLKMTFKDASLLKALAEKSDLALYSGTSISALEAGVKLAKANEEHYCTVKMNGKFNSKDIFELTENERKLVQEPEDIYQTLLTFKNANGTIAFNCIHATSNFFIEDFAVNFKNILNITDMEGQLVNITNYVNPRTENRRLNAITLSDLEKIEAISLDAAKKEGFAMANGLVDSADKLANEVDAGKLNMACMLVEKEGVLDDKKIFIRVDKGIAAETPADIPSATLYTIYRADEKTAFTLSCRMNKKIAWSELFVAAKDTFKFEALQRLDYNKKYDEMVELHRKLKSAAQKPK